MRLIPEPRLELGHSRPGALAALCPFFAEPWLRHLPIHFSPMALA